jgi:nucleoside-diphosphate-sugar epimerase
MNKNSKIFIAGHNGLVGSAVFRNLKKHGYKNLIIISKKSPIILGLELSFYGLIAGQLQ